MSGNDGEIYHFKIWLNVTFVDDLLFCLNKIFHIFHSPHQKSEEVLSPSLIIRTKIAQASFLMGKSPQNGTERVSVTSAKTFLAVQDSSISDIVGRSVCRSVGRSQLTIRA